MRSPFVFIMLLVCCYAQAQQQQPFKDYGYKVKIATLSNGKYQEYFDQDTLTQVGSVIINRLTGKIVSFIKYDTAYNESDLKPELISRWMSPDPLAHEFYSESPYNFSHDNPIRFVDPDGRAPVDVGPGDPPGIAAKLFNTISNYLFGDGDNHTTETASGFGNAQETAVAYREVMQERREDLQETVGQIPVLNVVGEVMSAQQSNTKGEMANHLLRAAVNINSIPVSGGAGKGTIYKVPGEATPTGKPYIGRHNKPTPQQTRRSTDGRDRSQATVIDTYDTADPKQGQYKEQKAIDDHGGVNKLDNKRNEVNQQRQKELDKTYGGN